MRPLTLSVSRGGLKAFAPVAAASLKDLSEIILNNSYSAMVFGGNARSEANFLSTDLMALDFDGGLTLEEAQTLFAPYRHVIATTRNHQKKKNNIVCDRFRVLLPLERTVTSVEEYRATWDAFKERYPAMDPACKDLARLWYASAGIVSVSEEGEYAAVEKPKPKPESNAPKKEIAEGERGKLSRSTLDLLIFGTGVGGRNNAVHKAARDFKQNEYTHEEASERILGAPLFDDGDFTIEEAQAAIDSAYKKAPKYPPRVDQNAAFKKLVNSSLYMIDVATNQACLFNQEKGLTMDVDESTLRRLFGNDLATYRGSNYLYCTFKYDPFSAKILTKDQYGLDVFNAYRPPEWQRDYFYFGRELPTGGTLPQVYQEFFEHLVAGDRPSYEYLLDWLATALTSRNYTMLTTVGVEGVGKGVLGEIMQMLVGSSNFVRVRADILKNKFNGQIKYKRLVYLDEVSVSNDEEYDRLKDFVNDMVEVERKGVDAEFLENTASYYISSNRMNAIRPSESDRRFSVIQLTDVKLTTTKFIPLIDSELKNPENIARLASFLRERKVTHDMMTPFRGERYKTLLEASLADWEHYIIHEWTVRNLRKPLELKALQEHLKNELDMRSAPGRVKIQALVEKFPNYLRTVKRAGGSVRMIEAIGTPVNIQEFEQEAPPPKPPGTPNFQPFKEKNIR
jgi:hypothetical protein